MIPWGTQPPTPNWKIPIRFYFLFLTPSLSGGRTSRYLAVDPRTSSELAENQQNLIRNNCRATPIYPKYILKKYSTKTISKFPIFNFKINLFVH